MQIYRFTQQNSQARKKPRSIRDMEKYFLFISSCTMLCTGRDGICISLEYCTQLCSWKLLTMIHFSKTYILTTYFWEKGSGVTHVFLSHIERGHFLFCVEFVKRSKSPPVCLLSESKSVQVQQPWVDNWKQNPSETGLSCCWSNVTSCNAEQERL